MERSERHPRPYTEAMVLFMATVTLALSINVVENGSLVAQAYFQEAPTEAQREQCPRGLEPIVGKRALLFLIDGHTLVLQIESDQYSVEDMYAKDGPRNDTEAIILGRSINTFTLNDIQWVTKPKTETLFSKVYPRSGAVESRADKVIFTTDPDEDGFYIIIEITVEAPDLNSVNVDGCAGVTAQVFR